MRLVVVALLACSPAAAAPNPMHVVLSISTENAAHRDALEICLKRNMKKDFPQAIYDSKKEYGTNNQLVISLTALVQGRFLATAETMSMMPAKTVLDEKYRGLELQLYGPIATLSDIMNVENSCSTVYGGIYKQINTFVSATQ